MKTPQQSYPELAKALGVPELYLKREDLHKYGSHKGRSIPRMIKTYAKEGNRHFVISSSGNAALAAIQSAVQHNKNNKDRQVTLRVLVGKNIDKKKFARLQKEIGNLKSEIIIETVERPKQEAFQLDKTGTAKYLRQSTDDLALEGYLTLAVELNKIPNLQAIFIPTSSGTTAQAIAQAFQALDGAPQIHIAQTTACHPMAGIFDKGQTKASLPLVGGDDTSGASAQRGSLAGAIVDNVAHRKDAVVDAIKKSNGSGWVLSDDDIKEARKIVREHTKIDISPNSALSVAALMKSLAAGATYSGPVTCLVTGA